MDVLCVCIYVREDVSLILYVSGILGWFDSVCMTVDVLDCGYMTVDVSFSGSVGLYVCKYLHYTP